MLQSCRIRMQNAHRQKVVMHAVVASACIKPIFVKKFGFGLGNQIQKYCPWVIQELKSEILKQVSDWVSANFFQDFINPNPKMKTRIFAGEDYWISFYWFIYFSVKYHWLIYSGILSFHWPKLNYTDMGGVR